MLTRISFSSLLLLTCLTPAFADKAADKVLDDCVEATKKLKTLSVEFIVSSTLPGETKPQIKEKGTLYFQVPDKYYFHIDNVPTNRQWITFHDGKETISYNRNDKIYIKQDPKEPLAITNNEVEMFIYPEEIKKLAKKGTSPVLLKPVKVKDELCQVVKIEGEFGTQKFYFGSDKLLKLYTIEAFGIPSKMEIKSMKRDAELPQDKMNWKLPAGARLELLRGK